MARRTNTEDEAVPSTQAGQGALPNRPTNGTGIFLGMLLFVGLVGGWLCWQQTYRHGSEECETCYAIRVVDRRGPFWMYSEPRARDADHPLCEAHTWIRAWR